MHSFPLLVQKASLLYHRWCGVYDTYCRQQLMIYVNADAVPVAEQLCISLGFSRRCVCRIDSMSKIRHLVDNLQPMEIVKAQSMYDLCQVNLSPLLRHLDAVEKDEKEGHTPFMVLAYSGIEVEKSTFSALQM